jgi:hypothetical protein
MNSIPRLSVEVVNQNLASEGYFLVKNFLTSEQCDIIMKETEGKISEWFVKENLLSHAAYISDDNKGRRSWAFALSPPHNDSTFPSVDWKNDQGSLFSEVTNTVMAMLDITEGRTLFNMQKYWEHSLPVHAHRDGEVYEADPSLPNRGHVIRALHPKKVALLTLFNNAKGGGTRIFFDNTEENSVVVCAQRGDLLIFDNVRNEHGVDELVPCGETVEGEVIRQIIGWRALEQNCKYLNKRFRMDPFKDVSFGRGCELQSHFFEKIWPVKRSELVLMGRI